MSIVVHVSSAKVSIPKYKVEIPLQLPNDKLSVAAQETYQILRDSVVLQTETDRDDRREAITLLSQYGKKLFHCLIPEEFRFEVLKEGGIYLRILSENIDQVPWELLHDGASFLALTQGVSAITPFNIDLPKLPISTQPEVLRVALQSALPLRNVEEDSQWKQEQYITFVEELISEKTKATNGAIFDVDGSANSESLISCLQQFTPHIWLFSGHSTNEGWFLEDVQTKEPNLISFQFLRNYLKYAVEQGLRVLFLNTSQCGSNQQKVGHQEYTALFQTGVPLIVTFDGRLGRERLKIYIQTFLHHIIQQDTVLVAHRSGLNAMASTLPLSWDWTWIRIRINTALLANTDHNPTRAFITTPVSPLVYPFYDRSQLINSQRFFGNHEFLKLFLNACNQKKIDEIICLQSIKEQPQEIYIEEFFRRFSKKRRISVSVLPYYRWGFSGDVQEKPEQKSELTEIFSILEEPNTVQAFFDQATYSLCKESPEDNRFLILLNPPEKLDRNLDQWLKMKQSEGWMIITLSNYLGFTSLPTRALSIRSTNADELFDFLDDQLLEEWENLTNHEFPTQMEHLPLLKCILELKNEELIQYLSEEEDLLILWKATLQTAIGNFSNKDKQVLITLYLSQSQVPIELLEELVSKTIFENLQMLKKLQLVHSDLAGKNYWIPNYLAKIFYNIKLFPESQLLTVGKHILQQYLQLVTNGRNVVAQEFAVFNQSLHNLILLGDAENCLLRNTQLGKRISKQSFPNNATLLNNVRTSLGIALYLENEDLKEKVVFESLEILDKLPMYSQVEKSYEWLLNKLQNEKKWHQVPKVQINLAKVYAKQQQKAKAASLLTASIILSEDIKDYSHRYETLIEVATLFLELGEIDKVDRLVLNADFDPHLLSVKNLARLWLIDGHLHYHDNEYLSSLDSFRKGLKDPNEIEANGLIAVSYVAIAGIYSQQNDISSWIIAVEKAIEYFILDNNFNEAENHHEYLWEHYKKENDLEKGEEHLVWLYTQASYKGNDEQAKKLANQLGELYHHLKNATKSAEYYKLAHQI
ncbi:MAG: hypothetical protein ACI86H_001591 [bacterium]|jgi:hypothetical protein